MSQSKIITKVIFLFDGRIPVNRISFVGPYWKKKETISIDG